MEEIINDLKYFNKKFPHQAFEAARENRKEITEVLLAELQRVVDDVEIVYDEPDYILHIYAMFLLAEFKEKRAFPLIVEFASRPTEEIDYLLGDMVTNDLDSLLYSTFDGNYDMLKELIEDLTVDIFARTAALEVMARLYTDGDITHEDFTGYLRYLLAKEDHEYGSLEDIANFVVSVVVERNIYDMRDDVQELYNAGRMDIREEGDYDSFIDSLYRPTTREFTVYIDDAAARLSSGEAYEKTQEQQIEMEERLEKMKEAIDEYEKMNRSVTKQKVGRNDPCPCGSGKKYKQCHLKEERKYLAKGQEPLSVQKHWLQDYPDTLEDHFSKEAIEIDKLAYLGLHARLFSEPNEHTVVAYLAEAFEKFKEHCEANDYESFDEFDEKNKIHYYSQGWVSDLKFLLERRVPDSKYRYLLQETEEYLENFK